MKKEADVKLACKKLFAECKVWFYMPVMNGFGVQGIPDFLGACNGHMFAVETKFGYNKPTEIQLRMHHAMQGHKIPVWVVSDRNFTDFASSFKEWCSVHR